MKRIIYIITGLIICGAICYVGYYKWETAIDALNTRDLDRRTSDDEWMLVWLTDLERELLAVPLGGTVNLVDIFPFEWDTVEIVNSPMGVDTFGWQEVRDYSEDEAFKLSSIESMSAFIFRKNGQIVDVVTYNYYNQGSSVIRPCLHDGSSDHAQYPREQALFHADHIKSSGEKVFLPAE